VSEFTHDISIVATIAGLDPIEVYATQTIADVEHFSRGVIDDANPEIPGTTGGVAGNRPDFLFVIAKGDSVQVELDNGADMDVSLLKGQTFGLLSGKTFTRTTDAGDTAVSSDAVGLNTVVGGRGSTFEYLALTKAVPDPCEDCNGPQRVQFTLLDGGALGIITTSTHLGVCDPDGNFSIQAPDGTATEPPVTGDNYFLVFGNAGEHCVFPCNAAGELDGTITGVDEGTVLQTTSELNLDSVADSLLSLTLNYAGLPIDWQPGVTLTALLRYDRQGEALVTPLLSRMPTLNYLDLAENDIADTDPVLQHLIDGGQSNGYVDISGGTNAIPTPALVSALEGDGWTVIKNE
jgi:hypothetical protein